MNHHLQSLNTNAVYANAKKIEIKNFGEYHNLYVQSGTLLLADEFENFRNMCLEIFEQDPVKVFQLLDQHRKQLLKRVENNRSFN